MKLFLILLRANAKRLIVAVMIGVLSGASSAGLIALVHHVWQNELFTSLPWLFAFLGVLLVLVASAVSSQLIVLDIALRAVTDLRMELCAKILKTPLRRVEELDSPRILAVLSEDVHVLARVLPSIPRVVIDGTTLIAGAAYMAWLSPLAFGVILVFIAIGIGIYRLLWSTAIDFLRKGRHEYDRMFEHFRALYDGIKQLKLNWARRQAYLVEDLHGSLESYRGLIYLGRVRLVIAENLTRLLFFGILGMLVFAVPRIQGIEIEVLSGFVLMALYLYRPLGLMLEQVAEFGRAGVSLQKVDELELSLDEDLGAWADEEPSPTPDWNTLELKGATYAYRKEYDDSVFTMGPIDVTFHPGEIVFVVGGNGSGKTTFAKILTSLYPMEQGEIRLDGELITEERVVNYRQLFSSVFSDYHLFTDLLGAVDSDLDAEATNHLHQLQLDHKVQVKDGHLSTVELSQGQRKRLALLAAYLEDCPFYVFDEWAADQDPEFKDIFYTSILPGLKARGKAVLVITHDDRYLYAADRVLKLQDGKLIHETVNQTPGDADHEPSGRLANE
jgi:putative ATP-binding cassette transporter